MSPATRVPYTIIVPTVYGNMMVNRNDINQTENLIKHAKAEGDFEIDLIRRILDLIKTDAKVFVDVGANIGTHSFAIARHLADGGRAHAFEPQRLLHQILCGTMALKSVTNAYCYNAAVGAMAGELVVPRFDYFQPMNFGSVEFGPERREKLHQTRGDNPKQVEFVPVITIDGLNPPKMHLLKIDAEGMEFAVLDGTRATIERDMPVLIIECFKVARKAMGLRLKTMGYRVFIHDMVFICIPQEYHQVAHQVAMSRFEEFVSETAN